MLSPQVARIALLVLGILIFVVGYAELSTGLADRSSMKNFELYGVHAPATLLGYRYIPHTYRSLEVDGDRPVFSYIAEDGVKRIYVAY